jgi:hypothetical protein
MQRREVFDIWAPRGAIWSDWAKPVVFATTPDVATGEAVLPEGANHPWTEGLTVADALVVELPGVESVSMGMSLAQRGYRPVPLFNAAFGLKSAVSVEPIGAALRAFAQPLRRLALPDDAPPAFLLDASRSAGGYVPKPGDFDNRWLVFPQDFPSGNLLRAKGIGRTVLISSRGTVADDLTHVLHGWQTAGIPVFVVDPFQPAAPREIQVRRPLGFGLMFRRLLVLIGFRRSSAGGFGGLVPEPSSGRGFA